MPPSAEQRANTIQKAALAEALGSQSKAARLLRTSSQNVCHAVHRVKADPELYKDFQQVKRLLSDRCFGVGDQALTRIEEALPNAGAGEAAGVFDKVIKAGLLLRGEATDITAQQPVIPPDFLNVVRKMWADLRERDPENARTVFRQNLVLGCGDYLQELKLTVELVEREVIEIEAEHVSAPPV